MTPAILTIIRPYSGRCLRPALPMNRAGARLGLTVGIAIALAGCRDRLPSSHADVFQSCVAMARDSNTQDMASAIQACSDAAQGMAARSDETPQVAQPVGQEPGPKDAPND